MWTPHAARNQIATYPTKTLDQRSRNGRVIGGDTFL